MNIKNKVVVISGAGSGIGKAIALKCADLGASIAISDINAERLRNQKRRWIKKCSCSCSSVRC